MLLALFHASLTKWRAPADTLIVGTVSDG